MTDFVVVEQAGDTVVVQETSDADLIEIVDVGPQGSSGTITVGTVTTGAPGTQVEVTNIGTPTTAVFNFKIPKGDTGDVTPEMLAALASAEASAANASASESAAASSATSAADSAASIGDSVNTAVTSATQAAISATSAAGSATNASASASLASTKASDAASAANAASTSASSAATQATAAQSSATSAAASASTASTKAGEAASSATSASSSATAAASSATSASGSATTATTQAGIASTKASDASTSASSAATSATNAAASATTASTKSSEASTSATNSANSASSASNSASTATTKASDAQNSATSAASSATAAASSATAAAGSATTASTQASNAATSATSSATSATLSQDWATKTASEVVAGQGYGAKKYAQDAAASAAGASSLLSSSIRWDISQTLTSPQILQALTNLGRQNVENKSSATIRSELTSLNVTTALGFTPYDASNPSGYITSSALASYLTTSAAASTYQTQAGMSSYLTTASAASTYLPLSGGTLTSTLNFSSGSRVTGDFTNGTVASRTLFQTSTANSASYLTVIPSGTAVNSQFQAYNSSDTANASLAALVASASQVRIVSGYIGSGALNPITFIFSNTEAARLTPTTLNFLIGTATDDAVNRLQVAGSVGVTTNLNFSGTGNRITGDFSNATAASRAAFQSSTVNGNTLVNLIPNGTATVSRWGAFNGSDSANSSVVSIGVTSTAAEIVSTFNGTGASLPLDFYVGGAKRVSIDTSGNVLGTDTNLTRMILKDTGYKFFDSTTTSALDFTNGSHQRWAPTSSSNPTLSITNWAPTGNLSELLVEAVNLAAAGTVTYPTANWIKSDGTFAASPSAAGVTFTSGTDFILFWTRDAGTTIYAKVIR